MGQKVADETKEKDALPEFVTIRIRTASSIETKKIQLDGDWKKEIVRETWKGDLTVPRTITRPQRKVVNEIVEIYALLAHAAAVPVTISCTKCNEDPILGECRVNAVWPAHPSCTCCGYKQTPNACSLRHGLNDRARFVKKDANVNKILASQILGLTWEQWLDDGLALLQDRESASQFHEKLKASENMVSRLLEMEKCVESLKLDEK